MSPSYSKSKVSAFFGSHHDISLRESIRQDVLIERYDDLQKEMDHIESLLNISEDHFNDDLFAINEVLFEILESLVPELIKEDHSCDEVHPDKTHKEWENEDDDVNEVAGAVAAVGRAFATGAARQAGKSAVAGAISKMSKKTSKTGSSDPDVVGQRAKGDGDAKKPAKNVDAIRKKRVADIKARETKAMSLSKDKESIIRAKSLIRTAQMTAKGAVGTESKKRARSSLNRARQQMTKIGKK